MEKRRLQCLLYDASPFSFMTGIRFGLRENGEAMPFMIGQGFLLNISKLGCGVFEPLFVLDVSCKQIYDGSYNQKLNFVLDCRNFFYSVSLDA